MRRGTTGLVWGLSNSFAFLPDNVLVIHTYLMNCSGETDLRIARSVKLSEKG